MEAAIENYLIETPISMDSISREMLLEMLQLEEKIRLSNAYSQECTRVKDEVNGWLRVSGEIQERVAAKFGFNDEYTNLIAVNAMRRGHLIYPDDERFQNVSVYVRNNLARKGEFKVGDIVENIELVNLTKNPISLLSLTNTDKYTVIIGSSET